jgi:hypothetical protein
MSEPKDMIVPMLREMREEMRAFRDETAERLEKIEAAQKSFRNAMTADTMMSKIVIGDFEERIVALEHEIRRLGRSK